MSRFAFACLRFVLSPLYSGSHVISKEDKGRRPDEMVAGVAASPSERGTGLRSRFDPSPGRGDRMLEMPSIHSSLHYHIVFSSKNREPWFNGEIISDLHAYLGGVVKGLDAHSHINGGVADHVHLLVGLKPTHRLSDFMSELKSTSSAWVKEKLGNEGFSWQEGYGAFTVGAPELDKVRDYISNQAEHHRNKTFQEEYLSMLNRGMVDYKEAYLW